MKPIKMPKIVCLKGKEAVAALSTFIDELEKQRGKELTDKQTDALIRIANELITHLTAETQTDNFVQRHCLKPSYYIKRIVEPIAKFI